MFESMQKCSTRTSEPHPEMRKYVEKTAHAVSIRGLEFEEKIKTMNAKNAKFNFLMSSDHPYHALYQEKLTEYLAARQQQDVDEKLLCVPIPKDSVELHKFAYLQVPEGTTAKEVYIMKLTAKFMSRFGLQFWCALRERTVNDPLFDFMDKSNTRYGWFWLLRTPEVLPRPSEKTLRENATIKNPAFMATVMDGFCHLLQRLKEKDFDHESPHDLLSDWDAFFSDNPSKSRQSCSSTSDV